MKEELNSMDGQSRRKFMMNAAKSALGVSMVPMLGNDRVYGAANGGVKLNIAFSFIWQVA